MTEWVLVFALLNGGVSVTTGFTSKEKCLAAGKTIVFELMSLQKKVWKTTGKPDLKGVQLANCVEIEK